MRVLYHFPFCPLCRQVRLALAEFGLEVELREEHLFERRPGFLNLNPGGYLPVLVEADDTVICGGMSVIAYLEESYGERVGAGDLLDVAGVNQAAVRSGRLVSLLPADRLARIEALRLAEWFDVKFNREVTENVVHEKISRRFLPENLGGGAPDMDVVRAGLRNLRSHLTYLEHILEDRHWLAGDDLSRADLAAAAHLSCLDYLGAVSWPETPRVQEWYARIKSRPGFRPLLGDRVAGMKAAAHYADLDF